MILVVGATLGTERYKRYSKTFNQVTWLESTCGCLCSFEIVQNISEHDETLSGRVYL